MGWPDAIADNLPPPHEGEPANLRKDIVDELADHLACAMTRELRRQEDEPSARRAVLDRFGDPLAVARRLWWDAMKEKIMKDRIILIGILLVLVGVVAALGMAWAAQNRVNEAILAKLEKLPTQPASSGIPQNWSVLKVKVVKETGNGPPVEGVSVAIYGHAFNDQKDPEKFNEITDRDGVIHLGPVRPGKYSVQMTTPEGLQTRNEVVLYPAVEREFVIVYPGWKEATTVTFAVEPASDLPEGLGDFALACQLEPVEAGLKLGDTTWSRSVRRLFITSNGEWLETYRFSLQGPSSVPYYGVDGTQCRTQMPMPPGQYGLTKITLLRRYGLQPRDGTASWAGCGESILLSGDERPLYQASPGENNTWQLRLPDQLIKNCKKEIAASQPAKADVSPLPGLGNRPPAASRPVGPIPSLTGVPLGRPRSSPVSPVSSQASDGR